jgi:hypothetical protein
VEGGFSVTDALRQYQEIMARNTMRVGPDFKFSAQTADEKKAVAIEAARFYERELKPRVSDVAAMSPHEIMAATDADNAGTLAGTLVLQESLPLFKYRYPVLAALYQDFSATPGRFNQTEDTRIQVVPAVQEFDETSDTDGRPLGWHTVVPAQMVDVPITLDKYIGVPVVFSAQTVASTMRRLFDETGPGAVYAIAKYFVAKMAALITPAAFNAYAAVTGDGRVPDAYATYPVSQKNFSMDAIDDIEAVFDQNEVPATDRGVLLNAKWHGQLRRDPRLSLFFAAQREPGIIEEGRLPARLDGFQPFRAAWLPATNNLVGFAFHKAGLVIKQRLPADFTKAINAPIPGSVTTVVDPDSGLSCLLVRYVNLERGYAEWRAETMVGAGVGDNRGGLCITSA